MYRVGSAVGFWGPFFVEVLEEVVALLDSPGEIRDAGGVARMEHHDEDDAPDGALAEIPAVADEDSLCEDSSAEDARGDPAGAAPQPGMQLSGNFTVAVSIDRASNPSSHGIPGLRGFLSFAGF